MHVLEKMPLLFYREREKERFNNMLTIVICYVIKYILNTNYQVYG